MRCWLQPAASWARLVEWNKWNSFFLAIFLCSSSAEEPRGDFDLFRSSGLQWDDYLMKWHEAESVSLSRQTMDQSLCKKQSLLRRSCAGHCCGWALWDSWLEKWSKLEKSMKKLQSLKLLQQQLCNIFWTTLQLIRNNLRLTQCPNFSKNVAKNNFCSFNFAIVQLFTL